MTNIWNMQKGYSLFWGLLGLSLLVSLIFLSAGCTVSLDPPEGTLGTVLEATGGVSGKEIVLSWKRVSGAEGYRVYSSPYKEGLYNLYAEAEALETEYRFQAPGEPFLWFFRITAVAGEEESLPSTPVTGWVAPTNLGGEDTEYDDELDVLTLYWDPVTGAGVYYLHYSYTQDGPFYKVGPSQYFEEIVDASTYGLTVALSSGDRVGARIRRGRTADVWFKVSAGARDSEERWIESRKSGTYKDNAK